MEIEVHLKCMVSVTADTEEDAKALALEVPPGDLDLTVAATQIVGPKPERWEAGMRVMWTHDLAGWLGKGCVSIIVEVEDETCADISAEDQVFFTTPVGGKGRYYTTSRDVILAPYAEVKTDD